MFKTLEALDTQQHAELKYRPVTGYAFARELTTAPLSASEVVPASRQMMVVFAGGETIKPVVLLSARQASNPFVAASGEWQGDYIPAHIRRYPFILGESGTQGRYVVMIDRAAPNFDEQAQQEGEPLFQAGKAPEGGMVERAREFLLRFQNELEQTERLLQPLVDKDVLVERQLNVTRDGKKEVAVNGFKVVDAEKLKALDDATLAEWARSGLLGLVYAHLHSQGNTQRLLAGMDKEPQAA